MNRDQWLEERRRGIGSSDGAAIVGLSEYTTALKVALDKLGQLIEDPEKDVQRRGSGLEAYVLDEYAYRSGVTVASRQEMIWHPTVPFMFATVDGLVPRKVVEGKTSRSKDGWGEPGTDQVPQRIVVQAQHQMACADLSLCDVPVLFGSFEFAVYTVQRDDELIAMLIDEYTKFWTNLQKGILPEPSTPEDVRLRFAKDSGKMIEATDDIVRQCAELQAVRQTLAAVTKENEDRTAAIEKYMEDAAELRHGHTILATWKTAKGGRYLDSKRLRAEQPELFEHYSFDKAGSRRFLLKEMK